ncbi:hypothetical protein THS5294_02854 [Thalassobacter stenotrophicus]|uniref:Uncharacterized protein n=2 Tax=Thalassobacter stenotrophicus TaxID=266809 RepID=A0A0P1FQM1_9RHOB|nr:hypothetical protein THS5294_02854 [Thalassobacter stenotrophicus]SHJ07572.1 hypothetical protein SAMN02744035_02506 [Thalassobacter stenotrophicus DSM 16310]
MRCTTLTGLVLSAGLTAGCAIETGGMRGDCDLAAPIRPSRQDVLSAQTLAQIVAHNEVGATLCGWVP